MNDDAPKFGGAPSESSESSAPSESSESSESSEANPPGEAGVAGGAGEGVAAEGGADPGVPLEREAQRQLAKAHALDRRVRFLFREAQRALDVQQADALRQMKVEGLHLLLGYADLGAYAKQVCGLSRTKLYDLLAIVGKEEELPQLVGAFRRGEIGYGAAREAIKVATPHDQDKWLATIHAHSQRELRALIRDADPTHSRGLRGLNDQEAVLWDEAVGKIRSEGGTFSEKEAILEVLRRFVEGEVGGGSKTFRVVHRTCPACEVTTQEGPEGPIVVPPEEAKRVAGLADEVDLREVPPALLPEPGVEVPRAIPSRLRNHVLERDERRCQVPGCGHRSGLALHHIRGWRAGHEAKTLVLLCSVHHGLLHEEKLRIVDGRDGLLFRLPSGVWIGNKGDRLRSDVGLQAGRPEEFALALRALDSAFERTESGSETPSRVPTVGLHRSEAPPAARQGPRPGGQAGARRPGAPALVPAWPSAFVVAAGDEARAAGHRGPGGEGLDPAVPPVGLAEDLAPSSSSESRAPAKPSSVA